MTDSGGVLISKTVTPDFGINSRLVFLHGERAMVLRLRSSHVSPLLPARGRELCLATSKD